MKDNINVSVALYCLLSYGMVPYRIVGVCMSLVVSRGLARARPGDAQTDFSSWKNLIDARKY